MNTSRTRTISVSLFLFCAIVGFIDATYLTVEHYLGNIPPCAITSGCETVLTSSWSTIAGVPVALLGALFYLCMMLLTIFYLKTKREKIIRLAILGTLAGLLAEVWFVWLQLFVIKNICFYCMISAGATLALCVFGLSILTLLNRERNNMISKIS